MVTHQGVYFGINNAMLKIFFFNGNRSQNRHIASSIWGKKKEKKTSLTSNPTQCKVLLLYHWPRNVVTTLVTVTLYGAPFALIMLCETHTHTTTTTTAKTKQTNKKPAPSRYLRMKLNVHSNLLRLINDGGKRGDGYLCPTTYWLYCHRQNNSAFKAGRLGLKPMLVGPASSMNQSVSQSVNHKELRQGWTQISPYLLLIHFTCHHTTSHVFFVCVFFFCLSIFRRHSTREPAASRLTYFIMRAYIGTCVSHSQRRKKIGRGFGKNAGEWTRM